MTEGIAPEHLAVVKDHVVLKYLVERGGQVTMTYAEWAAMAKEFDGYAVYLLCEAESFTLTMHSPAQQGTRLDMGR